MAHRHLMAVCVVCLLCAEHLPCKEHVLSNNNNNNNYNNNKLNNNYYKNYDNSIEWRNDRKTSSKYSSLENPMMDEINKEFYNDKNRHNFKDEILSRRKRHADHFHTAYHRIEMPEITKSHIDKIYRQFNSNNNINYNNNNQSTMSINGFEELITQLKLNYLFSNETAKTCLNEETFLLKLTHDEDDDHHHHSHDEDHEDIELSRENMMSICPILLYYVLNRDTTLSNNTCFDTTHFNVEDASDVQLIQMEDRKKVWLYSTLTVIIVSLSGFCGLIVIPIMDKHFYHLILQFLVALAIGTMTGDALLHLLPHAMLPLTPDQDLHTSMMHRGLITFGCIVFSYFFERFIAAVMECRQRKEKRDKKKQRGIRVLRESESQSTNATTCKHKYSSYPYCYDEINEGTKDNHHHNEEEEMLNSHGNNTIIPINENTKKLNGLIKDSSNDVDTNTLTLSTSLDDGSIESNITSKQTGNPISNSASSNIKGDEFKMDDLTVILREHQSKHHGHSHTHGHVHSPPESLSAVAWMVILGDGLHNFTDGMAIGAAFSSSIAGGFSTALAVLCHELPHELGDFAVLLKAGMSPKKVICYNILTAVLCVFGMVGGILLGDTPEASQYIFAGTAGLFIYIALVDMMPELTSSHGKEENCMLMQCSLQFSGMMVGLLCMLFIAIYEHDLKEAFTS